MTATGRNNYRDACLSAKEDESEVLLSETAEAAEKSRNVSRILLVEDNPVNQVVALGMLELLGCRTDVAENGQAAVDYMRKNGYDLILMDCHMPEVDGFAATKAIRNRELEGDHVPIILESAVGRGRVCVFGGAGQGATTRNSYSIPRSCNEDMCRQKRAIYLVAWFTQRVSRSTEQNTYEFNSLKVVWRAQLRNLGSLP